MAAQARRAQIARIDSAADAYMAAHPVDMEYEVADVMVDIGGMRGDYRWIPNPFGHASMATTGSGMYSFGTNTSAGYPASSFVAEQARYRDQTLYIFQTTPEQDAAIQSYMSGYAGHMNDVGYFDNCAVRTNNALYVAGASPFMTSMAPPTFLVPAYLGFGLQNAAGVQSYYIPQGGAIPDLSQFDKH